MSNDIICSVAKFDSVPDVTMMILLTTMVMMMFLLMLLLITMPMTPMMVSTIRSRCYAQGNVEK